MHDGSSVDPLTDHWHLLGGVGKDAVDRGLVRGFDPCAQLGVGDRPRR
jgi:hypothetical protein